MGPCGSGRTLTFFKSINYLYRGIGSNSGDAVTLKAAQTGDDTADMVLLLYGPRYDHTLLSYTDQLDKDDAWVRHLIQSL